MRNVERPDWRITYEGANITEDLQGQLLSITYKDQLDEKVDTIDIRVEDADGRWRAPWYPQRNDKVRLELGYKGQPRVDAGEFFLDEFELSGPPDILAIRGKGEEQMKDFKTRRNRSFFEQNLNAIAQQIAGDHGLTLQGLVPEIAYEQTTQNNETDVAFLNRLAYKFGAAFAIRGSDLVFHKLADLEGAAPVTMLRRKDLVRYNLRDNLRRIYKEAQLSYYCPKTKEIIEHTYTDDDIESGDTLVLRERFETKAQAEMRAEVALQQANRGLLSGTLVVIGNPRLVAGNTFELTDMGNATGRYIIHNSTHRVTRSAGYSTSLEVRRVP